MKIYEADGTQPDAKAKSKAKAKAKATRRLRSLLAEYELEICGRKVFCGK